MRKRKPKEITLKKDRVIELKIQNPSVSLKVIALNEKINYGYARRVWAKYKRNLVTEKGTPFTPFPFFVQNFGWTVHGPPSWYDRCPVDPSGNRNLQKVFKANYFSVILHKNGTIFVWDYHVDWKKHLTKWLSGWMEQEDIGLFFDYLVEKDQKHFAVNAPGVPTGFKLNIKGVGAFTTDKTPFKDGTLEYEIDPQFGKRLSGIESALMGQQNQLGQITNSMTVFGEAMKEHIILVKSLQEVSKAQEATTKMLGEGFREVVEMVKEMRK